MEKEKLKQSIIDFLEVLNVEELKTRPWVECLCCGKIALKLTDKYWVSGKTITWMISIMLNNSGAVNASEFFHNFKELDEDFGDLLKAIEELEGDDETPQ